jgi:hypothetical protein
MGLIENNIIIILRHKFLIKLSILKPLSHAMLSLLRLYKLGKAGTAKQQFRETGKHKRKYCTVHCKSICLTSHGYEV